MFQISGNTFRALRIPLLAGVGLYGVLTYNIGLRTQEIGVRLALGATLRSVVSLVLRDGFKLAATGLALGFVAALALTHLLKTILFEVSAFDPLSFAAAPPAPSPAGSPPAAPPAPIPSSPSAPSEPPARRPCASSGIQFQTSAVPSLNPIRLSHRGNNWMTPPPAAPSRNNL